MGVLTYPQKWTTPHKVETARVMGEDRNVANTCINHTSSIRSEASNPRPSTAAQLDELELREQRLASQVCEIKDIQAAVSELKLGLTGNKDDGLQCRLNELDRQSNHLELHGLSMHQLQKDVLDLKRQISCTRQISN